MRIPASAACVIFSLLLTLRGLSQEGMQFGAPGKDSVKTVLILNDDRYRFEQKDSTANRVFLVGHVRLQEDRTLIFCDSMIRIDSTTGHAKDNHIECFGNVRIFDGDSTNIYSDYLNYDALNKTALFKKNVKLTDGKGILTTQELDYNLNSKIGVYTHGGKVINNGSVLTSDEATYFEETKDVHFRKHVVLRDPQYDLSADSLLYNTQSQVSYFIAETFIQFKDSTERTVRTREGSYDLRNRKADFGRRSVITDGSQALTGDSIRIDDSIGISTVLGHGILRDTAQGYTILADYMVNDKKAHTFLATQNAVAIIKEEKDSIYYTADTLLSGRLMDEEAEEVILARQDSMHEVYVDSLYKVSTDSLHRLFIEKQRVKTAADSARARADSLDDKEGDSAHRITEKDESRDRAFDSTHLMPPDSSRGITAHPVVRSDSSAAATSSSTAAAEGAGTRKTRKSRKSSKSPPPATAQAAPARPKRTGPPDPMRPDSIENQPAPWVLAVDSNRRIVLNHRVAAADSTIKANIAEKMRRVARVDSIRRANALNHSDDGSTSSHVSEGPPRQTDSTMRYIKAFHKVRIFSDSLQAVADSMFYSTKDSIFRLFRDPIAWGSEGRYQITGDTLFVYTKNKKADRIYVFENGLAINKIGPNFYNQLKGTTINGFFKDGQIDFMRAKGNAENIYYMSDEKKAYTGVHKAHADIIDMLFLNKELNDVVERSDVEGSIIPFRKVNFDEMRLRGFKWQEERRPKSKFELFTAPTLRKL
jgi:lipopolysaccharide export system protein LptA